MSPCDIRVTLRARECSLTEQSGMCVLGCIMSRPAAFNPFTCPNCRAHYQVVKVEAGPETNDWELGCRSCSAPLASREGNFVLKYFLLRKGTRARRRA